MKLVRTGNTPLDAGAPQANAIATNFIPKAQLESKTAISKVIPSETESMWILDSGATHHIICDVSLVNNVKKVQGVYVDLPNGHHAEVSHTGTVFLFTELVLENVLCVLMFHYNLISLGELIKGSNCSILFHSNQCIIQDQHHGKMIGMAEPKKGLYQLVFPIFNSCKSAVNACSF